MARVVYTVGLTVGALTIVKRGPTKFYASGNYCTQWWCVCSLCQKKSLIGSPKLSYSGGASCGCVKKKRVPNPRWAIHGGKMSRKKEFYVYALLDPRRRGPFYYGNWKFDFEPFYIGKGKSTRMYEHLRSSGKAKSSKARAIESIRDSKREPIVITKRRGLTEKAAFDLEIVLIARIGRLNTGLGPLTNVTSGGEGGSGGTRSRASKRKQKSTMEAKTQEEKQAILKKISDSWARKTAEEREEIRLKKIKTRESWTADRHKLFTKRMRKNTTTESKAIRRENIKETYRNRTPAQKEAISEKLKAAIARRTPEQWAEIHATKRATRSKWSKAKTNEFRNKVAANSTKMHESRSKKDKEELAMRISCSVKEQHQRMGHNMRNDL